MTATQANRQISDQPPEPSGAFDAVWRPAGIAYLVVMLAGLAVGLWPDSVRGSINPYWLTLTPAVQTLTIAQAAFCLLVYPVIVIFRARGRSAWRLWPDAIVEMLFWTAISVVFYIPAVWLSGSSPIDAIRAAAYVLSLWPLVWVFAAWVTSARPAGSLVLLVSVFAAIGLPWLWYVSAEFFFGVGWSDTLWHLCPVTCAWSISSPGGSLAPLWALAVWPVFAAFMFAVYLVLPGRGVETS